MREHLENLYRRYNRREYVHPDPLEFLYAYEDVRDREIVGLIASSLAYGRVLQILKSVSLVLERMGPSPYEFLQRTTSTRLHRTYSDFKHRFSTGDELVSLLWAVKNTIRRHGTLNACFRAYLTTGEETILPALTGFTRELHCCSWGSTWNSLLPNPSKGSACKRLNLFLRWMVRRDEVDPGGWDDVPQQMLIVPVDTHMHRIAMALKLTMRRQADLSAALGITSSFRALSPDDPLRYDFALTRLGIRKDGDMSRFLDQFKHVARTVGVT